MRLYLDEYSTSLRVHSWGVTVEVLEGDQRQKVPPLTISFFNNNNHHDHHAEGKVSPHDNTTHAETIIVEAAHGAHPGTKAWGQPLGRFKGWCIETRLTPRLVVCVARCSSGRTRTCTSGASSRSGTRSPCRSAPPLPTQHIASTPLTTPPFLTNSWRPPTCIVPEPGCVVVLLVVADGVYERGLQQEDRLHLPHP